MRGVMGVRRGELACGDERAGRSFGCALRASLRMTELSQVAVARAELAEGAEVRGELAEGAEVRGELAEAAVARAELAEAAEVRAELVAGAEVRGELVAGAEVRGVFVAEPGSLVLRDSKRWDSSVRVRSPRRRSRSWMPSMLRAL
jgi:hypothetical protein